MTRIFFILSIALLTFAAEVAEVSRADPESDICQGKNKTFYFNVIDAELYDSSPKCSYSVRLGLGGNFIITAYQKPSLVAADFVCYNSEGMTTNFENKALKGSVHQYCNDESTVINFPTLDTYPLRSEFFISNRILRARIMVNVACEGVEYVEPSVCSFGYRPVFGIFASLLLFALLFL